MEHRVGDRIVTNLEAEIYLGEKSLGDFPIRDIGANGLCVENCNTNLKVNRYLQVVLKHHERTFLHELNMSALVVWAEGQHAGLMWARENLGFTNLLGQLSIHMV